ncbi:MAG TPA: hypothetical protein VGJ02_11195 [Pyrinomonadaceae bacterium]|jgi:hypothetical protein
MIAQQRLSPAPQALPLRERAATRLALLFGGTFIGVLIVLVLMAIFGAYADSRRAEADAEVQPAQLVIDPKIETDLAKAMSFENEPTAAEVQNPFVDREGISGIAAASSLGTAVRTSANAADAKTNTVSVGGRQAISGSGTTLATAPVISNKERHDEWQKRAAAGEYVGPEAETLSIDDLIPVGFSSGGETAQEVMLFSYSMCRTFSFPAGTRFYDGWLSSFTTDEVVFGFSNGISRRSYSRPNTCSAQNEQPVGAGSDY